MDPTCPLPGPDRHQESPRVFGFRRHQRPPQVFAAEPAGAAVGPLWYALSSSDLSMSTEAIRVSILGTP